MGSESAMGSGSAANRALASLRQVRARDAAARRWTSLSTVLVVVMVMVVTAAHARPAPGGHGAGLAISAALAGVLAGAIAAALAAGRLPKPETGGAGIGRLPKLGVGGAAVLLASSAALLWLQPGGGGGQVGLILALVLAAPRLSRRPAALVAMTAAVLAVSVVAAGRHLTLVTGLAFAIPVVAVCVIMLFTQRLRDAREQTEALLAELEESRGAEARAVALAERQRLAREMHDVLAHSLSGLMLQLEGARMLAASSPADPRLPEAVDRAHQLARDGLSEARRAIGMLRDEELPGPAALATLTGQFERHSGIPCSLRTSGQPRGVRPDACLALYRVTQEALTNVVKHADAGRVEVRLAYAADQISLTVEDFAAGRSPAGAGNAASRPPAAPGNGAGHAPVAGGTGGYGLTGMRERAELLGGTLTAGATPAGFRVELRVPA